MSKELVIKKDEHVCHLCGRISASKSVLKGVTDKKTKESVYHCTNSKKCAEDKKAGLTNGKRKIVRVKKVAVKKGNGKTAKSKPLEKKVTKLKSITEEKALVEKTAAAVTGHTAI